MPEENSNRRNQFVGAKGSQASESIQRVSSLGVAVSSTVISKS